jgi:hypothetical protein
LVTIEAESFGSVEINGAIAFIKQLESELGELTAPQLSFDAQKLRLPIRFD